VFAKVDSYQSGFAGVAVAKSNAGRLAFVSEFLDDMKRSGSSAYAGST
jgi:hypothetical protein